MTNDDVRIVHFIPGRVRLKVEKVKGALTFGQEVQETLKSFPGINEVQINTVTGSVLVTYELDLVKRPGAAAALSSILRRLFPALDGNQLVAWLESHR